MYKLDIKTQTIVEISNIEFSNLFNLKNPNIPLAVLTDAQSIAYLNDFFYSPEFELLEYIRDCSDKLTYSQLDMFTLGEIPFFGNDNRVFSQFLRDLMSQDLPNGLSLDFVTPNSLEEWPWVSNLAGWERDQPQISNLPAFKSLFKYDASGSVNLLSVCESLLNNRCCDFQIADVIDSLKKIESANRDDLLNLKIPLPNNQFLKIDSPIGLLPTKHSEVQPGGCFIERNWNLNIYRFTGFDSSFYRSFKTSREEWCDLKNKKFLITSIYSNLDPQTPIKSMIYAIEATVKATNMEKLLLAHKCLLKDHFLRLVVCLKKQAQDPISSFLPTNEIFTGIDIKKKAQDFLIRPSLELEESIILDPLFQTAMDVKADDLETLFSIYQNRNSSTKAELIPIFISKDVIQSFKFDSLLTLSPASKMPSRYIIK